MPPSRRPPVLSPALTGTTRPISRDGTLSSTLVSILRSHSPRNSFDKNLPLLLPAHVLRQASNTAPMHALYLDDHLLPRDAVWGMEQACQPGFGRSGYSALRLNTSTLTFPLNSTRNATTDYFFEKAWYSDATGELLTIGLHTGLSIWSIIPGADNSGSIKNISFVVTRPPRPRDLWWFYNERSHVLASSSSSSALRGSSATSRNSTSRDATMALTCETRRGEKSIFVAARHLSSDSGRAFVLTCDLPSDADILRPDNLDDKTGDVKLILHDTLHDIFWNFDSLCLPNATFEKTLLAKNLVTASRSKKSEPTLSAVLIYRNIQACLLEEWLAHVSALGFDHILVYQLQDETKDEIAERILMEYAGQGRVKVIPFFSTEYCPLNTTLHPHHCQAFTTSYETLRLDAMLRFPADWTVLLDVEERIVISALVGGAADSHPASSADDMKTLLLQLLSSARGEESGRDATVDILDYGLGPSASPQWACTSVDRRPLMEAMEWRSNMPHDRKTWYARDDSFNISDPKHVERWHLRIHRYNQEFRGVLDDNNEVFDNSTRIYQRKLGTN